MLWVRCGGCYATLWEVQHLVEHSLLGSGRVQGTGVFARGSRQLLGGGVARGGEAARRLGQKEEEGETALAERGGSGPAVGNRRL